MAVTVDGKGQAPERAAQQRQPSLPVAYSSLDKAQMIRLQQFFAMLDSDGDTYIGESDLKGALAQLGKSVESSKVAAFGLGEEQQAMSLPALLTAFATRLRDFDPEADLLDAFGCLDEEETGSVDAAELRAVLSGGDDPLPPEEIETLLQPPLLLRNGKFQYKAMVQSLRFGDDVGDQADAVASYAKQLAGECKAR